MLLGGARGVFVYGGRKTRVGQLGAAGREL